MRNEENTSCVIKQANTITAEVCEQVGINNLGLIELQTGDGQGPIQPTIGNVSKFEVEKFTEVELTDAEKVFKPSTFVDEGCDNFVLEMHYKIYFEAAGEDKEFLTCADGAKFDNVGARCCEYDWCAEGTMKKCTDDVWTYCPDY